MQIPKQPRTNTPSAENSQPEEGASNPASPESNETVKHAYQASVEGIKSAYLDAQREQLAAYLAFLEALQQTAKARPDAILEYLSDLARAQSDAQGTAEAHRKFFMTHAERQGADQKTLIDAATAYSQSLRDSYTKIEQQVRQQNQAMAEELKEAMKKEG